MSATLWCRNPNNYIREAIEAGCTNIAWDGGYLAKRKIDAFAFMKIFFGNTRDYQMLIINDWGSLFYNNYSPEPIGILPTWNAIEDSVGMLEHWAANPAGESDACDDNNIPDESRPLRGQPHIIVCHKFPSLQTYLGKRALQTVRDIQLDYPECEFYIHGLYTFMPSVNMKFAHFDHEPRTAAAKGKVYVPPGKEIKVETEIHRSAHWLRILGYSRADLSIPRNRTMFTIKAIQYAIDHVDETEPQASIKNKKSSDYIPDPSLPSNLVIMPKTNVMSSYLPTLVGDKVECDTCSLTASCKLYREGSVCTVTDSEFSGLASQFKTRDTESILDGMSRLTALSVARAEQGMAFEQDFGLDPEVTKLFDQAFKFAERFAKLNDPRLRVNINLNKTDNGGTLPAGTTVTQLPGSGRAAAAQIVAHFAELGIPADKITTDMAEEYLRTLTNQKELAAPVIAEEV